MIVAIFTSRGSLQPMEAHKSIEAISMKGLAGDRYATGQGFYSGVKEWDAHITLLQKEPFEDLHRNHGVSIEPKDLRRNLLTRDIDLGMLIGKTFQIGNQAVFRGRKAWPPCAHIVKQTGRKEIFKYLSAKCGIGADILVGGMIRLGDPIWF